jgi:PAS domain S-box-containing protein
MTKKGLPEILSSIPELIPTALFLSDEKGLIIYSNSPGATLLDVEIANLQHKNFLEFVDDNSKNNFRNILEKSFASTKAQKTELNIKNSCGEVLKAFLIARSVKSPDLKERLCLISIVDLTGLTLSKEISKRSELRFENMANTAPVMIWVADVDGLFSFVNKVWLDYTGDEVGKQLGMNWLKSVHPDDHERLLAIYKDAFKAREHFSAEFRFKRMNGEYQWMLIYGSPRVSEQGIFSGFIGSCININEQIKNEEKIKEINFQLSESNKTKDKFFSIISHDLRGPLSGLMQLLEILADDYNSLGEQEKLRLISEASASAKGTYNLMENLLDWARVQSGKMEYEPERINLLHLVEEIALLYSQNIKNKNISLDINIQEDATVFGDKKMSETVVRNLISNAIKFTFPSGSILILSEKKDDNLIVKIKDTGKGISEDEVANLFKLDVSHSTKGTENESGTGLGLILCKELVERQGGRIWVESKIKEGSTFYFTIPIAL